MINNENKKSANEHIVNEKSELLKFLLENVENKSASKIKSLLTHKSVMVDGEVKTKYNYILKPGQKVSISKYVTSYVTKSEMLEIIYEDKDLIVVNKPAGLLTTGTEKEREITAYNITMQYVKKSNYKNRIFIVHRLDKDTSGVLMFAKNEKIKSLFQNNWDKLVLHRGYIAIVEGQLKEKQGKIESWLKETSTYLVYSSHVEGEGKKSITNYKVLKENEKYSLVDIWLETGRKNQIRVHFKEMGNPVTGDSKYDSQLNELKRLGLHSNKLIIMHPLTEKKFVFEVEPDKKFMKFVK